MLFYVINKYCRKEVCNKRDSSRVFVYVCINRIPKKRNGTIEWGRMRIDTVSTELKRRFI